MPKGPGMNKRHKLFVKYYLQSFNATEAAKKAGYSEKSAYAQGSALLKHPQIRHFIENEYEERKDSLDISTNRVLQELARIAFCDISKVLTWNSRDVTMKPSDGLSEDETRAIQTISDSSGPQSKRKVVKMHDKVKALELLCRHLGILDGSTGDIEGSKKATLSEILQAVKDVHGCEF